MIASFKLRKLCSGATRPVVRMLSVNVQANVTAPPRTERRRRTLDPIIVTESAARRLQELLEGNPSNPIGIRLGTKKRGCNGLSYTLNYVTEISQKDEPMTTSNGVRVFIEPMALMNVVGTTMDWVETELSAEFTFTNPNSKGECGCGESFNV
jgi:iron-sulfur cluster assembly accessory protein